MQMKRAFFPETEYDLAAILRVNQKNADYLNGAIDPFGEMRIKRDKKRC